ncbi:stage II sporulation protein D [Oceanobacillus alkalisoli]|uniref:stage II sporulation protein D n=1 Tax=Oceanobacillus alkalisoli TaxID=2925113 RepID=UPI001EE3CC3A|nr:stage II sporulation protein D [Oceanobacillus alkalisoli]
MKSPKKNAHIQKLLKKKSQLKAISSKPKLQTMKRKPPPSINRKGSAYFRHHQFSYRLPLILLFASLLILIIAVPSLIVLPLNKSNEATEPADDFTITNESQEANQKAISVAVMRTKADVVEDVSLEDYIVGVVAAEMPATFEIEALKAQALAARTYTVNHLLANDEDSYDITDTVQHQVYKNSEELKQQWGSAYEDNMQKIKAAVEATRGEILTYEDDPIMPAYFSMSNGYTENSEDYWENELPYLRSVPSPWDLENPKLVNQETFTKAELEERLAITISEDAAEHITIARFDSGRVSQFMVEDNTFTGREIRDKLELRSTDFSVKQTNDHYIFTTKGNGHGIGMSQFGADSMAKEGKNYEEIVKHYYQGIDISTLDEAAPTLVSR